MFTNPDSDTRRSGDEGDKQARWSVWAEWEEQFRPLAVGILFLDLDIFRISLSRDGMLFPNTQPSF